MSVSWAASTLSNGAPGDGYIVNRYDAATLTRQTIGSGCAGTVTGTECTEASVPAGQWVYAVTPVLATFWRGPESPRSHPVVVSRPTMALSFTRVKPGTSVTGTAGGFLPGETVRYRLDSPTGSELTGTLAGTATPAVVPADGGGSVSLTVPTGTTDGAHKLYAVASPSGEAAAADIVVDATPPPAPVLTQTPTNPSGDSASFAFTEVETSATVECRLDTTAFAPCGSPVNYTALAAQSHTFEARATDTVGNVSSVASYTWTVNTAIPSVAIDFPAMGSAYNEAGFTAGCTTASTGDLCGSSEDDVLVLNVGVSLRQQSSGQYWTGAGFTTGTETWLSAELADAGWTYAISPASLPEGDYTARARASDGANLGYDTRTFTIDRTAPSPPVLTTPPPATSGPSVSVEFTTGDQSATLDCRMDGGAWVSCVSPHRYESLASGSHTFEVRAIDRAGNTSAVTSRMWTVDADIPSAALSFPNPGSYNTSGWRTGCGTPTTGDICGTAGDTGSGLAAVAVSIRSAASNSYWDGAAFAAPTETWLPAEGTSSWTYPFADGGFPADGTYAVRWRATDVVGNTTTGDVSLTVDTTAPPAPLIVQAPHDPGGPSAQFDFTIAETGAGSQCRLDSGNWTTCTAPIGYSELAAGAHTFAVRATDAAGNTSATKTHSWTVDTSVPDVRVSSPAGGRTYTDAGYTAGCGTPAGDICGAASDPQGNLTAVDLSIQRDSTQLYWNGTDFSSPSEVYLPATGTTSWSYALPASSFPGDDSYTVTARASDGAGLTGRDSVRITMDRTAPPAPTITSGPTGTTSGGDTFTFTGETGARFECRIDGGSWATCTSPHTNGTVADGSHTLVVRAVDAAGNTGPSSSRTWPVDATAPTIGTTFPAAGTRYNNTTYDAGCTAGTGDLCGTTTDSPAGVDKTEISVQQTSTGLYLSGTAFTSSGQTWMPASGSTSWSYPLAAGTFPADGTYILTVRATDTVGNSRTSSTSYVIDRTAPTAAGFTTTNAATPRRLDTGDTFSLTFSESVASRSIIAGWNGTTQNVVVRATGNGKSRDRLTIYNAANTTALPLGTISLNRTDYVSGAVTFGLTGTASTLTLNGSTLTVTLGTPSNSNRISVATGPANASWIPSASVLDLAGNPAATTTHTETDADSDF
ncbi:Ig-like domain repeat protein [Streptomyces sp. NPDC019539]|uniref:Ig-like domain repeat protein n=1 Tax=Streptomyces sp. NPDC019539 TaxID=3365063 RepID=UPI0037991D8D